jgi:CheY-like chemotaxis protein
MPKRALVVDDDFFFVEFLGELLGKKGYRVTKAYDGKEGLLKLEDGPFDILFADLIMPKIDGIQFIKIARRKFQDVPFQIIAVSGSLVEQMDQLTDAEVDCFVAKGPLEQMEAQINRLLDQVEQGGLSLKDRNRFVEPGTLYPRQVTGELIDTVNFQKAVIESIGFGILVVDRDARVINATSQALEILNASPGDILNKHITSLFPQQERTYLIDALKAVAQNLGLKKVRLSVILDSKRSRLTVSLLRLGEHIAGWIVAMEETDQ